MIPANTLVMLRKRRPKFYRNQDSFNGCFKHSKSTTFFLISGPRIRFAYTWPRNFTNKRLFWKLPNFEQLFLKLQTTYGHESCLVGCPRCLRRAWFRRPYAYHHHVGENRPKPVLDGNQGGQTQPMGHVMKRSTWDALVQGQWNPSAEFGGHSSQNTLHTNWLSQLHTQR